MDPANDFCICGNIAAEHDSHPAYIQTHALFLDSKFEVLLWQLLEVPKTLYRSYDPCNLYDCSSFLVGPLASCKQLKVKFDKFTGTPLSAWHTRVTAAS